MEIDKYEIRQNTNTTSPSKIPLPKPDRKKHHKHQKSSYINKIYFNEISLSSESNDVSISLCKDLKKGKFASNSDAVAKAKTTTTTITTPSNQIIAKRQESIEKINPDVFKKIFNRNYTNLEQSSTTATTNKVNKPENKTENPSVKNTTQQLRHKSNNNNTTKTYIPKLSLKKLAKTKKSCSPLTKKVKMMQSHNHSHQQPAEQLHNTSTTNSSTSVASIDSYTDSIADNNENMPEELPKDDDIDKINKERIHNEFTSELNLILGSSETDSDAIFISNQTTCLQRPNNNNNDTTYTIKEENEDKLKQSSNNQNLIENYELSSTSTSVSLRLDQECDTPNRHNLIKALINLCTDRPSSAVLRHLHDGECTSCRGASYHSDETNLSLEFLNDFKKKLNVVDYNNFIKFLIKIIHKANASEVFLSNEEANLRIANYVKAKYTMNSFMDKLKDHTLIDVAIQTSCVDPMDLQQQQKSTTVCHLPPKSSMKMVNLVKTGQSGSVKKRDSLKSAKVKGNGNKPSDETLKDAENISDIDDNDLDHWNDVAHHKNEIKTKQIVKSEQGKLYGNGSKRLSEKKSSVKDGTKTQVNKVINGKVTTYRCDSITLFDASNNINFCKMCKMSELEPPKKLENGLSKFTQVELADSSQYNEPVDKKVVEILVQNSIKDKVEKFGKMCSFKSPKKIECDEEIIKKRTRDCMKFWKQEEDKTRLRQSRDASLDTQLDKLHQQQQQQHANRKASFSKLAPKLMQLKKERDENVAEINKNENKKSVFNSISRKASIIPKSNTPSPLPPTNTHIICNKVNNIEKITNFYWNKQEAGGEVNALQSPRRSTPFERNKFVFDEMKKLNKGKSQSNEQLDEQQHQRKISDLRTISPIKRSQSEVNLSASKEHQKEKPNADEMVPMNAANVAIEQKKCSSTDTGLNDMEEPNDENELDSEMEEVEVVISLDSLTSTLQNVANEAATTSNYLPPLNENSKILEELIMQVLPVRRKDHVHELVNSLKGLINEKPQTTENVIPILKKSYNNLLHQQQQQQQHQQQQINQERRGGGDDSARSSFSDAELNENEPDMTFYETTELTVVRDFHQGIIAKTTPKNHNNNNNTSNTIAYSNNTNNQSHNNDDDDFVKIDEETLYIIERKRNSLNSISKANSSDQMSEVDHEIRNNFVLKNKSNTFKIIEKHITKSNVTNSNGIVANAASVNKLFADGLYDLNKIVVGRHEMSMLNEDYQSFKSALIAFVELLDKQISAKAAQFEINDYQLHFFALNDSSRKYKFDACPSSVLMLSYDKNNEDNFKFCIERKVTESVISAFRQKVEANKIGNITVFARINIFFMTECEMDLFQTFSIINEDECLSGSARLNNLVHVKYYLCQRVSDEILIKESKETFLDVEYLPNAVRMEIDNECKRFLRNFNCIEKQRVKSDNNLKYHNDTIQIPLVSMVVFESGTIQGLINRRRDEAIKSIFVKFGDQLKGEPFESNEFMSTLEHELNSFLICERLLSRNTHETDYHDLVKINKLDAFVSHEIVQSYLKCLQACCQFRRDVIMNENAEMNHSNSGNNKFLLIDEGHYYKCVVSGDVNDEKVLLNNSCCSTAATASLQKNNSFLLKSMHLRQNYIFSKHLKSAFPIESHDKLKHIKNIKLKQPKIIRELISENGDESTSTKTYSFNFTSSLNPDKNYMINIDLEKNEVTKHMLQSSFEKLKKNNEVQTVASERKEYAVQVDTIDVNGLKSYGEKSLIGKDGPNVRKYTYDVLDGNVVGNGGAIGKKDMELFDYEENLTQEYETLDASKIIKTDEDCCDIKSMQNKHIRDAFIMKEIDKMFYSIRDHECSHVKAQQELYVSLENRRRNLSWGYSAKKRHVRAKVMDLKINGDKRGNMRRSNSVFVRIDDYINPHVSRILMRSYSVDYLNQGASQRNRVKFVRVPSKMAKRDDLSTRHSQMVPVEYRNVPYGLRYWSILKLLEEERLSGEKFSCLSGDETHFDNTHEWQKQQHIVDDLITGEKQTIKEADVILVETQEILVSNESKKEHVKTAINEFMSVNGLENDIEMVKNGNKNMRSKSNSDILDIPAENLINKAFEEVISKPNENSLQNSKSAEILKKEAKKKSVDFFEQHLRLEGKATKSNASIKHVSKDKSLKAKSSHDSMDVPNVNFKFVNYYEQKQNYCYPQENLNHYQAANYCCYPQPYAQAAACHNQNFYQNQQICMPNQYYGHMGQQPQMQPHAQYNTMCVNPAIALEQQMMMNQYVNYGNNNQIHYYRQ